MKSLVLRGRAPLLQLSNSIPLEPPASIDLSAVEWVTPFDVAALALLCDGARSVGVDPTIVAPDDSDVRAYIMDVGLGDALGVSWGKGMSGVEAPLLRLTRLESSENWDDLVAGLWPMFRGAVDYELALRTMDVLSELVDNATTHGQSSLGTYVCVQRYTGATSGTEPGLWIGIADGGVGIPDHLRRNPRYADVVEDVELIRRARQPWVTGTTDRRGWGLVEVFQDATASGPSEVLIRSGSGEGRFRLVRDRPLRARYQALEQPVAGTWIHVRMDAT